MQSLNNLLVLTQYLETPTSRRGPKPSSASREAADKVVTKPKQNLKRSLAEIMFEAQRYDLFILFFCVLRCFF